jgi:hypothetical protein
MYIAARYYFGFEAQADARMLATLNNHADMGPACTVKYLMKSKPFRCIFLLLGVFSVWCAYALRVAERPTQEEFTHFANAWWCILVTLAAVG